jgi:Transposase DDE domain
MHRRIDTALKQIGQDLSKYLDRSAVERICAELGHEWREGTLSPFATLHWFLLQVLHGNTALEHVATLAKKEFTDSAYCQARMRLPLPVFQAVSRNLVKAVIPKTMDVPWHGHRTFLLDGSSFSMPDTPELQAHFGQPGAQARGCGFPVAKILALFHADTGLLLEVMAAPLRSHEMSRVQEIHPALQRGDVLVGDRGFCSYAHLALLQARGVHAVLRMHQRQIVDFTPRRAHVLPRDKAVRKGRPYSRWVCGFAKQDQLVEWFKPKSKPAWMSDEDYARLPDTLLMRELRYRIRGRHARTDEVTLVTTLLDPERYPAQELADLYGVRWTVETDLRHIKQTMKMDVLKCKTVEGVLKELTVFTMVYNLVRLAMIEAGRRQSVPAQKISFIDALRWLLAAVAGDPLLPLKVNPDRPGRLEPRVRKRRPKQFPLMKKPRHILRKQLINPRLAA